MPNNLWVKNLTSWYEIAKRNMPWRHHSPNPYHIWISEIMLQQTQVDTVIPYFNRFIKRFPSIQSLADSDLQDVLKLWEGLGYYSRARNLHKAAVCIVETQNGIFPTSYSDLLKLPGIGPYTAAAISSIAYEDAIPVVDGNVLRVFCRFWGIGDDIRDNTVKTVLSERLQPFIESATPSIFNQAIMELGALVCRPKNPTCEKCPLKSTCFAFKHNRINEFPFKSTKTKVPHHDIAVAVILSEDAVLIRQRPESKMLGGLWEFPGDNYAVKTTQFKQTLISELTKQFNQEIIFSQKLTPIKHAFSHFKITLHPYIFITNKCFNAPTPYKWVSLDTLKNYPFPTANKKIINQLFQN